MHNRILITLLLCLGIQTLKAQDPVGCTYLLDDAREAFEEGMVELVPELLLECIQSNGLSGESRKEAYRLVITSYLFDYLPAEADSLMDDFVREFPEYRADNSDAQEFAYLLDAHLIALGINPDQVPEDTVAVVVDQGRTGYFSRRSLSKGAGEYGNTIGFSVGGTLTLASKIEGYSVGDPALDESNFGLLPGFLAGAEANLILNRRMEASFGLIYSLTRFSYNATPLSFTSYRYVEAQHQLLLPLALVYKLNPENRKYCYYLKGGIEPNYLFLASGKGTRSYEATLGDVNVDGIDITESRVNFNLDILLGGGIRIPLNNAFIFAEAQVSSSISMSNREESRYQNNDLNWLLYHVDSDFRVYHLYLKGGICWDLTKE